MHQLALEAVDCNHGQATACVPIQILCRPDVRIQPPPFILHVEVMISCLGSSEILFMPLVLALLRANLTDIIFCGCPARHRSNSALMFVMRMTSQLNFPQPPSVYEDSGTAWLPGHMVTQIIGRHCRHKQFSGNTSDLYPLFTAKCTTMRSKTTAAAFTPVCKKGNQCGNSLV